MYAAYAIEFVVINLFWAIAIWFSGIPDMVSFEIKRETFWEKVWRTKWWLLVSYTSFALVVLREYHDPTTTSP